MREIFKNNLILEKSITRDWSLLYTEIWCKAYMEACRRDLGWSLSVTVYEVVNKTVVAYRSPVELFDGLKEFVFKKLDKDKGWVKGLALSLKSQVESTVSWISKIQKKPLSQRTSKELLNILKEVVARNINLGPSFIIILWFPIAAEGGQKSKNYRQALKTAVKARGSIEKIGPIADLFLRELSGEILNRAGISKTYARYASYGDLLDFLNKKDNISYKTLLKRKKYCIVTGDGIIYEKAEKFLKQKGIKLKRETVNRNLDIKGQVAFPGRAQGKVRIIRNRDDVSKFKKGEILVTSMTAPDYLPVIKMSAAFVTDEGGITCHAAIASREVKKPCIIGTKSASKILKNGDLVEVDANKGMVIIKKRA